MTSIIMCHQLIPNNTKIIKNIRNSQAFSRKGSCFSSANYATANKTQHCSLQLETDQSSTTKRRSGNYRAPLWDFDFIESLTSDYSQGSNYQGRASELKMQVKKMLEDASMKPTQQLELIDDLQRLAISYHFVDEIKKILSYIYDQKYIHDNNVASSGIDKDLYSTALEFRLLRQHGYHVSQEIFDCFKNEKGEFKSNLSNDTKALLQLYEASYLLTEGDDTLEMAKEFSTKLLQQNLAACNDENFSLLVRKALEMPLHWRVPRPNARWFMDIYEKKPDKSSAVLELAKLDYNTVQATYQDELKEASRWWKSTRLAEILPFARDRVVENYFWATGIFGDPKHGYARFASTKIYSFINVIDDIYDIYGTMEELELFTNAIQRWDIVAMDQLPKYMQICFLGLNNFVDELAYDVLKEQGVLIVPYLRQLWIQLCEVYLQEAKWSYEGYTPRLEEYMDNAWLTISVPAILSHAYFLLENPIKKDVIQSVFKYHDLIRWSAIILRLSNDLGTSPHEMERGDVTKSVQCYMHETGVSEMEARDYVMFMIHEAWKKMNEERVKDSPFSDAFISSIIDIDRTSMYVYEHGDGQGIQNPQTQIKQRISDLIFEPVV